jgi:hypothetical protein
VLENSSFATPRCHRGLLHQVRTAIVGCTVQQQLVVRVTTLRAGCWTPACGADDKTTLPGRPPFIYRKPSTLGAPWPCASYINPEVSDGMIITAMFVMVPLEGGFAAGEFITRTAVVGRGPQGTLPGLQCESQPAAAAPAASASSTTNSSAISSRGLAVAVVLSTEARRPVPAGGTPTARPSTFVWRCRVHRS